MNTPEKDRTRSTLRIAHIDTERTWRGGENQVFSLIKGLHSRGHSNLAVVRKGSALCRRLQSFQQQTHEVGPWGEWDFVSAHFLNRKLKSEKIDIVHAHTAHGAALAALSTLGTQIPIVITRRVDFHLSKNPFSRWKYKRAAKIIAISQGVRRVLLESGIPDEKITVVPSGVDFSRFEGIKKVSRAEMGVPEDSLVIGQVAALAPHKDQKTFLQAMALLINKHPQVHAVLVGEGKLRKALEDLANRMGIESHVLFLGFHNEPLRYLSAFDIFCLSSKEEGLGTSILDAMALQIPVVATRVGGILEMVEEGVTGYLSDPRDPQKLADALSQAISAGDKNKDIVSNALSKSHQFDISHTITQTEAVYRSLSNEI